MFCPKCGERNPDGNHICFNCGNELPDYSVDNSGGAAVGISVFLTILFTILAIILKIVADDSSSSKESVYFFDQFVGYSSLREIYNIAFGFCVFCALFMFFLIIIAMSKKKKAEEKSRLQMYRLCPYCHEKISPDAIECIYRRHQVNVHSGYWVCPKCRRKNINYVGTCACGEEKP